MWISNRFQSSLKQKMLNARGFLKTSSQIFKFQNINLKQDRY